MSKRKSKKDLWGGLALPVIKKVSPTLVASHLVSVTPLAAPAGMIYVPYIPAYITNPVAELHIPTPEEIETAAIREIENKIKEEIGLPVYRIPEQERTQLWEDKEVDLIFTSVPITAPARKIKATWSKEAVENLKSYSGIDAEAELANLLKDEIDKETVKKLSKFAKKKINPKFYGKVVIKKEP